MPDVPLTVGLRPLNSIALCLGDRVRSPGGAIDHVIGNRRTDDEAVPTIGDLVDALARDGLFITRHSDTLEGLKPPSSAYEFDALSLSKRVPPRSATRRDAPGWHRREQEPRAKKKA